MFYSACLLICNLHLPVSSTKMVSIVVEKLFILSSLCSWICFGNFHLLEFLVFIFSITPNVLPKQALCYHWTVPMAFWWWFSILSLKYNDKKVFFKWLSQKFKHLRILVWATYTDVLFVLMLSSRTINNWNNHYY